MATLLGHFTIPIQIAHSSTDAADSSPFAMQVSLAAGGRYIRLVSYELVLAWNAVAGVSGTKTGYWLNRFTILLPQTLPSGGTAVVPVPDDKDCGFSTCVARCLIKQDGALTMTNATNTPIALLASSNGVTGQTMRFAHDFGDYGPTANIGVGFNLSQLEQAVAGKTLTGWIRYAEYAA